MPVQQCNRYARKDFQARPVRNEEKEKIRYFKTHYLTRLKYHQYIISFNCHSLLRLLIYPLLANEETEVQRGKKLAKMYTLVNYKNEMFKPTSNSKVLIL